MWKSILSALFGGIFKAIGDYIKQRQLEKAQTKAAALKGKIDSMKEAHETEEEMRQVVEDLKKEEEKIKTLEEKLKSVNDFGSGEDEGGDNETN